MTHDDLPGKGEPRRRRALFAAFLLLLGTTVIELQGCAGPVAQQAAEPARATGTNDSNLEQRLRELQQAEALYLSGRFKEAQAAFEQLARSYPNNPEVWFRLGNTLMKQGRYDDAAGALQTALGLDPGNGRAALNLALSRLAQAQSAIDIARGRFAAGTPERQEAETIDRRLKSILSNPAGADAPR
jgi:tetratricopeptide (TPR) repeat protein